jgi:hypothetical protein
LRPCLKPCHAASAGERECAQGGGAARSRNGEDSAPLNAGKGEAPISSADRSRAASNRRADLMIRSCAEQISAQPELLGPPHTGGNVPPLAGVFASGAVLSISPGRRAACEHRPRRLPGGTVGKRRHGSTWPVMAVRRQLRGLLHTPCSCMHLKRLFGVNAVKSLMAAACCRLFARALRMAHPRVPARAYYLLIYAFSDTEPGRRRGPGHFRRGLLLAHVQPAKHGKTRSG